jgi:hypothetical protein
MSIFWKYTDIFDIFLCRIGLSILTYVSPVVSVMMFFVLVGALHQLRRFIALGPEDERKGHILLSISRHQPSAQVAPQVGIEIRRALP